MAQALLPLKHVELLCIVDFSKAVWKQGVSSYLVRYVEVTAVVTRNNSRIPKAA